MRRAGSQVCQRGVRRDQLCDAVPRGVLQSKRRAGMETDRYRAGHGQVTTMEASDFKWASESPAFMPFSRLTRNN